MNTLGAALALGLFAAGCADAHAQPRRDAGAARRWILPPRAQPGGDPFRGDGGLPAAFLRGAAGDATDVREVLAGAATTAGAPPPARDTEASGTLGRPAREGRFDDPERLAGIPLGDARMQLAVAGGWALRCLERARLATPFDAPVRFTVAREGAVEGVAAEGAPEAALRCLVEGFGHARFRPVARPTELVARYRYTVRGRPPPGSEPRPAP
ncbi:MAG: hypothetical protein EPO40_05940 [Myxococcaceae bacterium]|nr:MAG: hypothetical protein EPO40_05940 [Myxococcaceae bacterium]